MDPQRDMNLKWADGTLGGVKYEGWYIEGKPDPIPEGVWCFTRQGQKDRRV